MWLLTHQTSLPQVSLWSHKKRKTRRKNISYLFFWKKLIIHSFSFDFCEEKCLFWKGHHSTKGGASNTAAMRGKTAFQVSLANELKKKAAIFFKLNILWNSIWKKNLLPTFKHTWKWASNSPCVKEEIVLHLNTYHSNITHSQFSGPWTKTFYQ